MSNQIFVYDFTLGSEFADSPDIKTWLTDNCKKWTFQLEVGEESGYVHWQGRFSLKAKTRLATLKDRMPWKEIHLSPTSKVNQGNDFYVSKEDTRLDGPWCDTDKTEFIPEHLTIEKFHHWQISIMHIMNEKPGRVVHCIYEPSGNVGKSTFIGYLCCKRVAVEIPFCNDFKDIMRMVMCQDKLGCYFIDMPRAIGKEKLRQLYAGIECIKNGYAYDDRYKFHSERFNQPHVFVFTNAIPQTEYLSIDRWKLWTIDAHELILKEYSPQQPTAVGDSYFNTNDHIQSEHNLLARSCPMMPANIPVKITKVSRSKTIHNSNGLTIQVNHSLEADPRIQAIQPNFVSAPLLAPPFDEMFKK